MNDVDIIKRIKLLSLNWRGRAEHYRGKQWYDEASILEQCADDLDSELKGDA